MKIFTTRARILERHDRAVVIEHGCPARPVIVPIANVDVEPDGSFDALITGAEFYRFTMSHEAAKEYGLTV